MGSQTKAVRLLRGVTGPRPGGDRARCSGRERRARGQLTRVWFQAFIESAAMACAVTRAASARACARLRLAWQHAVTLLRRRLAFLQSALWTVRTGWTKVRPAAWRRIPLNLVASAHALFIALNGVAPRRQASALRTRRVLSRPLLALNLVMVGLSVFFSIRVGHALFTRDLQSPSRIARPLAVTALRSHDVAPNSRSRAVYEVIATRTLCPSCHRPKRVPRDGSAAVRSSALSLSSDSRCLSACGPRQSTCP